MDDELLLRICNQIQDTLALEREDAANTFKAELERQHVQMMSNLMAQLRSQDTDPKVPKVPTSDLSYSLLGETGSLELAVSPVDVDKNIKLLDSSQRYQQKDDALLPAANGDLKPAKGAASNDIDAILQARAKRRPSVIDIAHSTGLEDVWMHNVVEHPRFETGIIMIVALSIAAIAIDVQVSGLDLGYRLGYPHITSSPENTMPWLRALLNAMDFAFGIIFTIEMVLKIAGWKQYYFLYVGNWLDISIVLSWIAEVFLSASWGNFSPFILRIFRLLKILRLLRLAKHVDYLDSLFLLVESIKASKSVVFWSTVLLVVIQMGMAIVLNQALRGYMESEDNTVEERRVLFMYFGTFFRSNVTMFEVTFGNFVPVLRLLSDIWEYYAVIIITFKVLVGFVALRIISGIFMTETLRLCSTNDLIMVMQRKRKQKQDLEKMTRLFRAADHSGDGHVTEAEFMELFEEETVRIWLAAQDFDVVDPHKLFRELAGNDDTITAEEMMAGITRMRGFARATDIAALIKDHQGLVTDHRELMVQHTEMQEQHKKLISLVRNMDVKVGKLISPTDAVLMYEQGTGPVQRLSHC